MIVAGEPYTLSGLARTEFNGLKVVAKEFKDGRWVVEMLSARPDGRSKTTIRIKAVNLIATAATGGGGGGTAAQSALSSPPPTQSASKSPPRCPRRRSRCRRRLWMCICRQQRRASLTPHLFW